MRVATPQKSRERAVMLVLVLFFGGLVVRLAVLQVANAASYRQRSEQNAVRIVPIDALRGRILDRTGQILVGNRPSYSVAVIPAQLGDVDSVVAGLAKLLNLPAQRIREKIPKRFLARHRPVVLKRDVGFHIVAQIEERSAELPGVLYLVESRRRYPKGAMAAHALGYVREIKESQLHAGYAMGDLVGQSGLELVYESVLRGEKGQEYQEVTASGRVEARRRQEPVRGEDINLSMDLIVQEVAEEAFHDTLNGAAIAIDPRTGEVLALVSRPAYDPRVFAGVVSPKMWGRLNSDPRRPLFNRAVSGTYPPGSTAKMIAAMAALDSGLVSRHRVMEPCLGLWQFGRRSFGCWFGEGHGILSLINAIETSCNVYFYQLGNMVGLDLWARTASKFGLGGRSGIDLPNEVEGQIASPEMMDRLHGKGKWSLGEMLNVAIGQGPTVTTPIQMVRYVAALATGKLSRPRLILDRVDTTYSGQDKDFREPAAIGFDENHFADIRDAMQLVTEGHIGTAHRAMVYGFHTAGKTGTAQNPHGRDHSWFVGFAPATDPTIAVAVVAENAGHGSSVAAPIAGRLFRAHLNRPVPLESARAPRPPHGDD